MFAIRFRTALAPHCTAILTTSTEKCAISNSLTSVTQVFTDQLRAISKSKRVEWHSHFWFGIGTLRPRGRRSLQRHAAPPHTCLLTPMRSRRHIASRITRVKSYTGLNCTALHRSVLLITWSVSKWNIVTYCGSSPKELCSSEVLLEQSGRS